MKIKTITCHDVYNFGASLQAYALQKYLQNEGHYVEIINYKPEYLRHFKLWWMPNSKFDRPIIRNIYRIVKFPKRLWERIFSKRKKAFDKFTKKYLHVTNATYFSYENLVEKVPEADVYIAGSDQIWNPLFQNGKDPAFFLGFVPCGKKKISYAASFAVSAINDVDAKQMKSFLKTFDYISVREQSGLDILESMGLTGIQVVDPIFLLSVEEWREMEQKKIDQKEFLLVYDFDGNSIIQEICEKYRLNKNVRILSVFDMERANEKGSDFGPCEFLTAIDQAEFVVSNSFHATAFSILFHKDFIVVGREEKINVRMMDFLNQLGLSERYIDNIKQIDTLNTICWEDVDSHLEQMISQSKKFLRNIK